MELPGSKFTGAPFYHTFLDPRKINNSIIDFDIENLKKALNENDSNGEAQKITQRMNDHFLDSSRAIKRAFGNQYEHDFQQYTWGLSLIADIGLDTDKLELLLMVYAKKLPRRVTADVFELIMWTHSSLRKMPKEEQRPKWLDLAASFKIHGVIKRGLPDSIGKRSFNVILDVNDVTMDINFERLTKDMRAQDKQTNKFHMLLVDDPLVYGNRKNRNEALLRLQSHNKTQVQQEQIRRMKEFRDRLEEEEEFYGIKAHPDRKARLRKKFEENKRLEERRKKRTEEKKRAREEAKIAAELARKEAVARLEEIKRDRIEFESRMEELKLMQLEDAASTMWRVVRPHVESIHAAPEHVEEQLTPEALAEQESARLREENCRIELLLQEEKRRKEQAAAMEALRLARAAEREKEEALRVENIIKERMRLENESRMASQRAATAASAREKDEDHPQKVEDRGEVTHFPLPVKPRRVTSIVQVPKDVTGDKREVMFLEQLAEHDKKSAKDGENAKKMKKLGKDKLKSRLANDLKGIASTKLHVENEKERLLKNAHIIAEVKAKQAEEAMAKAEQDKHDARLKELAGMFVDIVGNSYEEHAKADAAVMRKIKEDMELRKRMEGTPTQQAPLHAEATPVSTSSPPVAAHKEAGNKVQLSPLPTMQVKVKRHMESPVHRKKREPPAEGESQASTDPKKSKPKKKSGGSSLNRLLAPVRKEVESALENKKDTKKAVGKPEKPKIIKDRKTPKVADSTSPVAQTETISTDSARAETQPADSTSAAAQKETISTDSTSPVAQAETHPATSTSPEAQKETTSADSTRAETELADSTSPVAQVVTNLVDSTTSAHRYDEVGAIQKESDLPTSPLEEAANSLEQCNTLLKEQVAASIIDEDLGEFEEEFQDEFEMLEGSFEVSLSDIPDDDSIPDFDIEPDEEASAGHTSSIMNIEGTGGTVPLEVSQLYEDSLRNEKKVLSVEMEQKASGIVDEHRSPELPVDIPRRKIVNTDNYLHEQRPGTSEMPYVDPKSTMGALFAAASGDYDDPTEEEMQQLMGRANNDVSLDDIPEPEAPEYEYFQGQSVENDPMEDSMDDGGSFVDEESSMLLDQYFYNNNDETIDDASLDAAPAFVIHDVGRPLFLPNLEEVEKLPSEVYEILVPKAEDGELKIIIRYDDHTADESPNKGSIREEHKRGGLFVHGFKSNSKADSPGLLCVGDEILSINGVDVQGQHLYYLVVLLEEFVADDSVLMKIRRRFENDDDDTSVYGSVKLTARSRKALAESHELLVQDMENIEKSHDDVSEGDVNEKSYYDSMADEDDDDFDDDRLEVEPPDPMFSTLRSDAGSHFGLVGLTQPVLYEEASDNGPTSPGSPQKRLRTAVSKDAFDDYEYIIPKSIDGALRIIIMKSESGDSDPDGVSGGLFIHGFKSNSKAEDCGLLKVGDELVSCNGIDIHRKELFDIATILDDYSADDYVLLKVRRRRLVLPSLRPSSRLHKSIRDQLVRAESESLVSEHDADGCSEINDEYVKQLVFNEGLGADKDFFTGSPFASPLQGRPNTGRSLNSSGLLNMGNTTSLMELRELPTDILQYTVPKTNGELCLFIRHDDEGVYGGHGLFIHGFKQVVTSSYSGTDQIVSPMKNFRYGEGNELRAVPDNDDCDELEEGPDGDSSLYFEPEVVTYSRSLVEQQGLLRIGDELITINGVDVEGKYLEDVAEALVSHTGDEVSVCVKRRKV